MQSRKRKKTSRDNTNFVPRKRWSSFAVPSLLLENERSFTLILLCTHLHLFWLKN